MKKHLPLAAKLVLGAAVGYALSHALSHPKSKVRKYVPKVRVGNVQLTHNLKIESKKKKIHIHHWTYLPALFAPLLFLLRRFRQVHIFHGMILGGVIQGLMYSDRFTFVSEIEELKLLEPGAGIGPAT